MTRLRRSSFACLLGLAACGGCTRSHTRSGAAARSTDSQVSKDYRCEDGFAFRARVGRERADVDLADGTVELTPVPSASGARYSNGRVVFWSKGDDVLLEAGGERHANCRPGGDKGLPAAEAPGRGVSLRAVGNEPGWLLEIDETTGVTLRMDYGQTRIRTPFAQPSRNAATGVATYRIRTEAHALDIAVDGKPCQDVMSGRPFPATVTIRVDGRTLRGCGQALP